VNYVRQLTAPATEPVTLAEARLWCRIDADDMTQDAMLLLIITAVRERAEEITGRAFMPRTLEYRLDAFPDDGAPIELPFPPLQSVQYLTYGTDDGDVVETGSPQGFLVDVGSYPGRVAPLAGTTTWPTAQSSIAVIRIGYTAGYPTITQIPKSVRLWMQARISTIFEFREQMFQGNIIQVPRDFVDGMLDVLRVRRFFA